MRREFAAVLCAVALLLSGCQGVGLGTENSTTPTERETPGEVASQPADGAETETATAANATDRQRVPPDPDTDRLGWEGGYWHNESLAVTNADGLNESELDAVVNRSMARVEYVRGLEFDEPVPVDTRSRADYRNRTTGGSYGEAFRTFDNAKFEALFLIGEREGSIETQEQTLGSSVAGYYSPAEDAIVIVTDSETPRISEGTLGHELVHALQDQQFGLDGSANTRDAVQGRNSLIEGDARTVDSEYTERCGAQWECATTGGSGGGGQPAHWGVYFMLYFPYSDGSAFVSDLRAQGGWAAVDDAYADVPEGAREVMNSSDYAAWEPRQVSIPETPGEDWDRVRPSTDRGRPDYATVGPSAIAAGMVYTLYDGYNRSSVIDRAQFFNTDGLAGINRSDPFNYALPGTQGWDGGRMHVYTDGNESGYVWRTTWTDNASAERFASSWQRVVAHWGGSRTDDGNWVIDPESPFADAVAVHVEGDTVTVVNAPTEAELSELYDA